VLLVPPLVVGLTTVELDEHGTPVIVDVFDPTTKTVWPLLSVDKATIVVLVPEPSVIEAPRESVWLLIRNWDLVFAVIVCPLTTMTSPVFEDETGTGAAVGRTDVLSPMTNCVTPCVVCKTTV
jgi:hypothetical protein